MLSRDLAFWGWEREEVKDELDEVGEVAAEDCVEPDEVEMTREVFDLGLCGATHKKIRKHIL